jgi:hypothetical protein
MDKRKKITQFKPSNLEIKSMVWCIHNNIIILPEPTNNGIFLLVNEMGIITKSGKSYTNEALQSKIYELYTYLYAKHKTKP